MGQCVSDSPQPQNRRLNRPQTKTKGCSYEKKISDRGRRNPVVHTDEQNDVHCRWPDPAGRQCLKRCRQNRQKLADAMVGIAGITGAARLGNPDYALRCAVSLLGGYVKTNQRPAFRFDGRFNPKLPLGRNLRLDRERTGGGNHQLFRGLPENKAGDYRHASKGAGFQRQRRKNGHVRQRLRRHFLHQEDCRRARYFHYPRPPSSQAEGRGRSVQRGIRLYRHHRCGGYQLCAQAQKKQPGRHPSCLRAGCGISGADPAVSRPEMGAGGAQEHGRNPQGGDSAIPFSGSGIYENPH